MKVYDSKEQDWEIDEDNYVSIIPDNCRWCNWAVDDRSGSALTGDTLLNFVNQVARRCREAKVAADLDEGLGLGIPLLPYDDTRIYPFSAVLAGHFSMASFIHPYLQMLEDYDARKGTELVATLEVYMRNNYNIASTAREFFTHRNTIDYRLRRIEELIGAQISDPNVNMALWLSLQARKLEAHKTQRDKIDT